MPVLRPTQNQDDLHSDVLSDCAMCSPAEMDILISTVSLFGWPMHQLDVKSAFLQTGSAVRDVYVTTPRESPDQGKVL